MNPRGSLSVAKHPAGIADAILALGTTAFDRCFLSSLNHCVASDMCSAFVVSRAGNLRFVLASSHDSSPGTLPSDISRQYADGFWELDPSMSSELSGYTPRPITLHRQSIGNLAPGRYRNSWEQIDVADRVSVCGQTGGLNILLNLYRRPRSGTFCDRDLKRVSRHVDFLCAMIAKHVEYQDHSIYFSRRYPDKNAIIDTMAAEGFHLSPREADICANLILGMSSKEIALELDIRATSVVTYIKRAYQKLGVNSRRELSRKYRQILSDT